MIMNNKYSFLTFVLLSAVLALSACRSAKEVVYLQDIQTEDMQKILNYQDIKIKPGDLLSIFVSHKEPQLSALFNPQGATMTEFGQTVAGYTVDLEGNIDFPIIGRIKVAGLTRSQLSSMIKNRLDEDGLLKDAVVLSDDDISKTNVSLGSTVTLRDEETKEETEYSIVNANEEDIFENRLSVDSPVGKAIIGKKKGASVTVTTPAGAFKYKIVKIGK